MYMKDFRLCELKAGPAQRKSVQLPWLCKKAYFSSPSQLKADEYGQVRYVVGPAHNRTTFSPEQIGSYVLRHLQGVAELNLSAAVTKAVMSVPAEFNPAQRNATRAAANLLGKAPSVDA